MKNKPIMFNKAFMKSFNAAGKTKLSLSINTRLLNLIDCISDALGGPGTREDLIEKFMLMFMDDYLNYIDKELKNLLANTKSYEERKDSKTLLLKIRRIKSGWKTCQFVELP